MIWLVLLDLGPGTWGGGGGWRWGDGGNNRCVVWLGIMRVKTDIVATYSVERAMLSAFVG